jgi:hypothetical protein
MQFNYTTFFHKQSTVLVNFKDYQYVNKTSDLCSTVYAEKIILYFQEGSKQNMSEHIEKY